MRIVSTAEPVRLPVMMVDDQPILREGMALFLSQQPDLDLCHQAGTAAEGIAIAASNPLALAIVDVALSNGSGLDLIRALRRNHPGLPILALSLQDETVFAERALRAGANGYLMKSEATGNILLAIRQVLAGGIYLSAAMHHRAARQLAAQPRTVGAIAGISDREMQVLQMLGRGLGTRQISETLNRSIKTVESHRASLKQKLRLHSGTDLLRYAVLWVEGQPPHAGARGFHEARIR